MVSRATLLGFFYMLVQGFKHLHLQKVGQATQVLTVDVVLLHHSVFLFTCI
jgi:hypothetical protein